MIGGVLGDAWGLYRRFFWRFVLVAVVVFAVLDLLSAVVDASSDSVVGGLFWGLVSLVAWLVGFFWVQGALTEAVRDVRDGRIDTTVGELYERTRPRLPALIVSGVLAGLGVVLGLVLLIIPGLYLLTRWALIVPVVVLEARSAGEAFSRSWEIIRGNAWSVFGLVVVTILVVIVASAIVGGVLAFLPDFLRSWIGGVVAHSLITPFVAAAWTLAYYRLTSPAGAAQVSPA